MKTVEYDIIDLPEIAIIGKEGLCTKEKNLAQDLWRQANSDFRRRKMCETDIRTNRRNCSNTDRSFISEI